MLSCMGGGKLSRPIYLAPHPLGYQSKIILLILLTRGVQYVMKTAQYIPKYYIYTLCNFFNLKVCFLAKYMYKCSCPAYYLIYTSHFQDRVLKYTVK